MQCQKRAVQFYKNVLIFLKGILFLQFEILRGVAPKFGEFLAGIKR